MTSFLEEWLESHVKSTLSPQTYKQYRFYVEQHIKPELGRTRLLRLAPADVQRLMANKMEEGLAPRTVELIRAILRSALTRAERWGYVVRNVAKLVDPPRRRQRQIRFLSAEEGAALLVRLRPHRLWALFVVGLTLGLRSGELRALRWEDIDFERQELRVEGNMQRINGALIRVEPKTETSRRVLALPQLTAEALLEHRDRQHSERQLYRTRWRESGLAFTTTIGTPLDGSSLTHVFQAAMKEAGLPRIRLHDLRHSCATFLARQGVDARVAMEILGHSQISVTLNIYTHVLPEARRQAAARIDDFFATPTGPQPGGDDHTEEISHVVHIPFRA